MTLRLTTPDPAARCSRCGETRGQHRIRNPRYPDVDPPGSWCPNGRSQQFQETPMPIQFKVPNLDNLTPEELDDFAKVVHTLKEYARYRDKTLRARREGRKGSAETAHRNAEACYALLPDWAQFRAPGEFDGMTADQVSGAMFGCQD